MTDRKLVRLRTAPMPDPGEWCFRYPNRCPAQRGIGECDLGYEIPEIVAGVSRRPQSCIDAAEEVET